MVSGPCTAKMLPSLVQMVGLPGRAKKALAGLVGLKCCLVLSRWLAGLVVLKRCIVSSKCLVGPLLLIAYSRPIGTDSAKTLQTLVAYRD